MGLGVGMTTLANFSKRFFGFTEKGLTEKCSFSQHEFMVERDLMNMSEKERVLNL